MSTNRYVNEELYKRIELKTLETIAKLDLVITSSQMLDTIIKAGIDIVTPENYLEIREKNSSPKH